MLLQVRKYVKHMWVKNLYLFNSELLKQLQRYTLYKRFVRLIFKVFCLNVNCMRISLKHVAVKDTLIS